MVKEKGKVGAVKERRKIGVVKERGQVGVVKGKESVTTIFSQLVHGLCMFSVWLHKPESALKLAMRRVVTI